jgi:hypothetical protein
MAAIMFVHGTGVRKASYESTLALIRKRVEFSLPTFDLAECFWGEEEGCRLHLDGTSIPDYESARATVAPPAGPLEADRGDLEVVRWRMLYSDPDYELRMIGPAAASGYVPGAESAFEGVLELLDRDSEALRVAMSDAGISDFMWTQAKTSLRSSSALRRATDGSLAPLDVELLHAVLRALIARAVLFKFRVPEPPDDWPTRQQCEAIVRTFTGEPEGTERAIGGWVMEQLKWFALDVITDRATRKRGVISDAAYRRS